MRVCKKVEEKGHTSYNEVADELVKEFVAQRQEDQQPDTKKKKTYDEKNIRRRVYDALNVLMAMDIVSKEKKEIRWKGLPSHTHADLEMLHRERAHRLAEVQRKRECLQDLLVQNVCFRNLVRRNQSQPPPSEPIPLPFIVVNTSNDAVIQCEMAPDRSDVMFDFSMPFEINDDNEILKRIGLNKTNFADLRAMLPPDLLEYCQKHRMLDSIISSTGQSPYHSGIYPTHNVSYPPPSYNPHHSPPPHGPTYPPPHGTLYDCYSSNHPPM